MRILLAAIAVVVLLAVAPRQAQAADAPLSYAGKTALVTGSTDGLGRELALALAADGAHVIVHGRNAQRGQAVVDEITRAGKGSARFIAADFSSLQATRDFADTIARDYPRLDLLVNNAGIAFNNAPQRSANADGYELQFVVNYLAGWILVNRLLPNLEAAAPSRIVNISSGAAAAIDFDDVMLEKPGAHHRGYAQSKLAQAMMTTQLAPAFAGRGVTMISLHPATLMDTTMVKGIGIPARTTVAEGRDHVMGLVTAPTLQPGAFYLEGKPVSPMDPQAGDAQARARLVALSAELTGVP
ncbi:SDR family NAD(P)-dependent oxidoreductase [Pseudoxanthomonas daejeonensis]|uniref:3-oxoacyl-ACP reductase n=1 Tax=Pseudoxanthomonas daejeonensis TaxID=266062 RepID=A0ABQ6Z6F2_9GAMM|nr:SDR family NAD(P)-dependent oxidoreductase [Pseudoxanthomonas daejeonensis]KAF1694114.1 3-oxoacyl-ACP reductase [Pseudoxanthomonas daejeonensis]